LESVNLEASLIRREAGDLQEATARMQDLKEKILAPQPKAGEDAGKSNSDGSK